jgi:hypothetical protein
MTKSWWFRVLACLAVIAFFASGQQALAQDDTQSKIHFRKTTLPKTQPEINRDIEGLAVTANLYPLSATFTASSYPTVNSDGTELWFCAGNTSTPNPDCPTIGDPQVTFPTGGIVLGLPQYTWSLSACDGSTNGSGVGGASPYIPCGQIEPFYEDDTGDSTDDFIFTVEVTQGTGTNTKVILDYGTTDFGANTTPPGSTNLIAGDVNFGTLRVPTGPNNGNCSTAVNYPTTSSPSAYPFTIAGNKTCVDPVAGLATITVTTEIATPHYTKRTTAEACAPTAPPRYTVTFTKKYSITQKWNIWLQ